MPRPIRRVSRRLRCARRGHDWCVGYPTLAHQEQRLTVRWCLRCGTVDRGHQPAALAATAPRAAGEGQVSPPPADSGGVP